MNSLCRLCYNEKPDQKIFIRRINKIITDEMQYINLNGNFKFDVKEKVSIFLGAYGSGKSEVAVNFALFLADKDNKLNRPDLIPDVIPDVTGL